MKRERSEKRDDCVLRWCFLPWIILLFDSFESFAQLAFDSEAIEFSWLPSRQCGVAWFSCFEWASAFASRCCGVSRPVSRPVWGEAWVVFVRCPPPVGLVLLYRVCERSLPVPFASLFCLRRRGRGWCGARRGWPVG